jgi:hypothetical protein
MRPAPGPGRIVPVPAVEGVVNDHLSPGEELDVGTAHAPVLDLLVLDVVIDRDDVKGLHIERIGGAGGRMKGFLPTFREGGWLGRGSPQGSRGPSRILRA